MPRSGALGRTADWAHNHRRQTTAMTSPSNSVYAAISQAESLLPGVPAGESPDPRWQAIIRVAEFLETHPEEVWAFTARWGTHDQEDLRGAIACCILEHLLDFDFATFFPRVQTLARANGNSAETLDEMLE